MHCNIDNFYKKNHNNNTNFVPLEQFDLSTPWDVSTAVPRVKKLYLGDQETEPLGIYVKPDGKKYYIIDEDMIQHKLLTSITNNQVLFQWKHKTKINNANNIKNSRLLISINFFVYCVFILQGGKVN